MKNIFIKGIDEELEKTKTHRAYNDLDTLAGAWSEEDGNESMNATDEFSKVESEIWE